jgi:hypothetical protein
MLALAKHSNQAFTLSSPSLGFDERKWRKMDCKIEERVSKSVLGVIGEFSLCSACCHEKIGIQ